MAHYGVDPLDRRVTLRRIHVLLRRLPAGAWPDPASELSWSMESHLLAAVVDSLSGLVYVTLKAAGAKSPKKPTPIPRPKPKPRPPTPRNGQPAPASGWADLARALLGQKDVEKVIIGG